MCQINPMSEIRAIAETSRRKCIPANARLLWRVLFDCANDRQERDTAANTYDWPDDFFPITNDELRANSALEKRALLEARNVLKEIGAIDFIPGGNNRRPARYKIRYLTAGRDRYVPAAGTAKTPACKPADVPIYQDQYTEIYPGKDRGHSRNIHKDDDDGEEDIHPDGARVRAGERSVRDRIRDRKERYEEIRRGFISAFGREPNPGEMKLLVEVSWEMRFSPVMVSLALEKASLYEPGSPVQYVLEMLKDWKRNEVGMPHHVDEYQYEYLQMIGKAGPYDSDASRQEREDNRSRRHWENTHGMIMEEGGDLPY